MKNLKVALQLYSVRDEMEKDMDNALKTVKGIGYDYVEFAGYFGHSSKEIRCLLDKYDLKCISAHQGYEVFLQNEKENTQYIKDIGAEYCVVPWTGKEKQKGTEMFDKTIKELKQVGKALKEAGITLLYHNHDFEFELFEDKFLLDWLYESIPSDLLQTEIDTCWVRYAGYDPAEYIKKYAGRSPIVHLKDFVCKNFNKDPVYALIDNSGNEIKKDSKEESNFKFQPIGYGIQDFPAILKASEIAGVDYVVVEQDSSPDHPQMEAAKMSRDYLLGLGL
jgi:sugar phosphate isomerase/epimerase